MRLPSVGNVIRSAMFHLHPLTSIAIPDLRYDIFLHSSLASNVNSSFQLKFNSNSTPVTIYSANTNSLLGSARSKESKESNEMNEMNELEEMNELNELEELNESTESKSFPIHQSGSMNHLDHLDHLDHLQEHNFINRMKHSFLNHHHHLGGHSSSLSSSIPKSQSMNALSDISPPALSSEDETPQRCSDDETLQQWNEDSVDADETLIEIDFSKDIIVPPTGSPNPSLHMSPNRYSPVPTNESPRSDPEPSGSPRYDSNSESKSNSTSNSTSNSDSKAEPTGVTEWRIADLIEEPAEVRSNSTLRVKDYTRNVDHAIRRELRRMNYSDHQELLAKLPSLFLWNDLVRYDKESPRLKGEAWWRERFQVCDGLLFNFIRSWFDLVNESLRFSHARKTRASNQR